VYLAEKTWYCGSRERDQIFSKERKTPNILLVNKQIHGEALYCLVRVPLRFSCQPERPWNDYVDTLSQLVARPLLRSVRTVEFHLPKPTGDKWDISLKSEYWKQLIKAFLTITVMQPYRSFDLRTLIISVEDNRASKSIDMKKREQVSHY
jgi:hypothetical protein